MRKSKKAKENLGMFLAKPTFRSEPYLRTTVEQYDPQNTGYLTFQNATALFSTLLKESEKMDGYISKAKKGPVKVKDWEVFQNSYAVAMFNEVDPDCTNKIQVSKVISLMMTEEINTLISKVEAMTSDYRQFVYELRTKTDKKAPEKSTTKKKSKPSKTEQKEQEEIEALWEEQVDGQEIEKAREEFLEKSSFMKVDAVNQIRKKVVENVSSVLEIDYETAQALLVFTRWNEDLLMTQFFENRDEFLQKAGVNIKRDTEKKVDSKLDPNEMLDCSICFDNIPRSEGITLPECGHWFCPLCWKEHLESSIAEANVGYIPCMQQDCGKPVPANVIESVVDPKIFEKYSTFLSQNFVDQNTRVRWCPAAGCQTVITDFHVEGWARTGSCGSCGYRFCWDCPRQSHGPLECERVKEWEEVLASDSYKTLSWLAKTGVDMETLSWLQKNTKECPTCGTSIQKVKGCIHMHCASCNADWCWACGKIGYGHPGCSLDSLDPDKVINQDNKKYDQRRDRRMMELSKALNKVEENQKQREVQQKIYEELPANIDPLLRLAHQTLLQVYDTIQYAAIAWCTHEKYNQAQFEIEEQNLGFCISNLKEQLSKPVPQMPEIRHLISVTRKTLDNFLSGEFSTGHKKKSLVKKVKKQKK